MKLFRDRREAGRRLARRLSAYRRRPDALVLGLPRGGVVTAHEVARALQLPLDAFVVRKLGVPGREELALGAIASGGVRVVNQEVMRDLAIPEETLEAVAKEEAEELARREALYRGGRAFPDVGGLSVILVDDGAATGSTMAAAAAAVRRRSPGRLVIAVPVAPPETAALLREIADEAVCLETPEPFAGVGDWYEDFSQIGDEEVRACLPAQPAAHG